MTECMGTRTSMAWAVLFAATLSACGNGEESPRPLGQEGAHEHGVARIDLAVDGNRGTVSFRAPAAEIYGFEHAPASDEERARRRAGLEAVETRMGEALVFDPALECEVVVRDRGWEAEGGGSGDAHHDDPDHAHDQAGDADHAHDHGHDEDHQDDPDQDHDPTHDHADGHADVEATFDVRCQAPLAGTRLRLAVAEVFPGIVDVDLQVVSGRTSGGRYRSSGARVEL